MAGFFRSSRDPPAPPPRREWDSHPTPPRAPLPQYTDIPRSYTPSNQSERKQPPSSSGISYAVVECPSNPLALTNGIIVNPRDFPHGTHVLVKGAFPLTTKHDNLGKVTQGQVGFSSFQRQWIGLSAVGDQVSVLPIEETTLRDSYAGSMDLEVGFWKPRQEIPEQYSADEIANTLIKAFGGQIFGLGQILVFDFHGQNLKAVVKGIQVLELSKAQKKGVPQPSNGHTATMGILMEQTDITIMKAADSLIKLKGSAKKPPPNAILAPNFKFEDMGIGGLDSEFSAIFRRAFASRVFPPGLVEKLGIQHVKGILLFGPPGTGKTLMARQIGKMLNAREPKIVNGPEILNKYVGASEENIRKLFADAEKEYKAKGDESGLHIIIFDELDAICKQRGSTNNGTGVGDSVVNQLLSKMDGVDQLNNILLIGMTNRIDMIDEALLRPGRLEVHMEISLPDEKGRLQILNIHTAKMRQNKVMDKDVDIAELAALSKNFSGAEIGGLVKSATSFAFNRHVKVGTMAGVSSDIENLRVNRDDFMHALDEVHPAFGVSEEELQQVIQNGIIHYDGVVDELLHDGQLFVEQVRSSTRTPLVTVLLHGPPGTGKSALAATIAQASQFPFIKLLSPESMVGFPESQKVAAINKIFQDSYKSPLSVIVVDNIERLLEWVPIGPRLSNAVMQTLLVLLARRPPKGRRLLILATTSLRPMLTETQMAEVFDAELNVPPISTLRSLEYVLRELQLFSSDRELQKATAMLEQAGFGKVDEYGIPRMSVGIKKLVSVVEMARQEPEEVAERLVSSLMGLRM
ncbi:vesicular-fusion protein SEC18 [Sistotremastrum suecicum HHB10207 ss-3]|uniref:Vesicular-fusion protein SEC18 n=1 Tax=Sistotremastrum suecicum HHB10207 ss-3 TaxID=1314776 RepID=A0A166HR57_9AGAM|nr:vesicular-fusion protein SEC18 [Sistotremastrum suecicum HHB10207 ss-3]